LSAGDHTYYRIIGYDEIVTVLTDTQTFSSRTTCAQPPMVTRTQICRRDLPRESWTTVRVRLNPAHNANDGRVDIWLNGAFCGTYQGPNKLDHMSA
jgi:hypothetical protein